MVLRVWRREGGEEKGREGGEWVDVAGPFGGSCGGGAAHGVGAGNVRPVRFEGGAAFTSGGRLLGEWGVENDSVFAVIVRAAVEQERIFLGGFN